MGKNNKQIFSSFKRQSKSKKKQQEENIKYAQELGQKMLDSKKKVREDFMLKLLENAIAINQAREDWESEDDPANEEESK